MRKISNHRWVYGRLYENMIKLQLQIVDYWTPKYFHIQIGKYAGNWSFAREQSVRNELYDEEIIQHLNYLDKEIYKHQIFFSTNRLNRQYVFLRILMCHYAMSGEMEELSEYNPGLQVMLDWTLKKLSRISWNQLTKLRDELNEISMILTRWIHEEGMFLEYLFVEGRGREIQVRKLSYAFNIVWSCLGDKYKEECKDILVEERSVIRQIKCDLIPQIKNDFLRYADAL